MIWCPPLFGGHFMHQSTALQKVHRNSRLHLKRKMLHFNLTQYTEITHSVSPRFKHKSTRTSVLAGTKQGAHGSPSLAAVACTE